MDKATNRCNDGTFNAPNSIRLTMESLIPNPNFCLFAFGNLKMPFKKEFANFNMEFVNFFEKFIRI